MLSFIFLHLFIQIGRANRTKAADIEPFFEAPLVKIVLPIARQHNHLILFHKAAPANNAIVMFREFSTCEFLPLEPPDEVLFYRFHWSTRKAARSRKSSSYIQRTEEDFQNFVKVD
jgi:hypothetical protein